MAITVLPSNHSVAASEASLHHASKTKILFVTFLFLFLLLAFITQTEFTSQAYQLGFSEPFVLLLVTHGSWWVFWPMQVLTISAWRTYDKFRLQRKLGGYTVGAGTAGGAASLFRSSTVQSALMEDEQSQPLPISTINYWKYYKKCIVKQFHNVYHTSIIIYESNVNGDRSRDHLNHLIDQNPHISSTSSLTACVRSFFATPSIKYVVWKAFLITLVLTIAGGTWYGSMAMTYASDVTAIYNCSAFTAYAFAIPLLNERFSWLKASSVVIAISGVFIVAYSGDDASAGKGGDGDGEVLYPYRVWGNTIIFVGAILYGYYEVLYKKYLCIPEHLAKVITPRRQMTFANFVMAFLGFFTCTILLFGIIVAQVFHIHRFNVFDYGDDTARIWLYIAGSIVSNLLFSAAFLSLMALTSPVLSSVSSLLTIFLIGVVEWWLFGITLSAQQLLGDFVVVVGFVILTAASWKDISEGNDDDDVENVSTYSLAMSYEGSTDRRASEVGAA